MVGRAVSGLPTTCFSLLPPHFTREDLEIISELWPQIHPDYGSFPCGFQKVFPFLLASLIYHQEFLKHSLPINHPIFLSGIFQNRLEKLGGKTIAEYFSGKILLGNNYCEKTGMQASGIPPTIMVMHQVEEQNLKLDKLYNFMTGPLMERLATVPENTIAKIYQNNLTIEGAPFNMAMMTTMIGDLQSNLCQSHSDSIARLEEIIFSRVNTLLDSRIPAQESVCQMAYTNSAEGYSNFYWDSDQSYHWFPVGYQFKAQNIDNSWRLWFYGDHILKISPLRTMYKKGRTRLIEFSKSSEQQAFSRLSYIMKKCETLIEENGNIIPASDSVEANKLFCLISQKLLDEIYGPEKSTEFYTVKLNRISVSTFANILTSAK